MGFLGTGVEERLLSLCLTVRAEILTERRRSPARVDVARDLQTYTTLINNHTRQGGDRAR